MCEQFGYKPEEAMVQLGWHEEGEQLPYGVLDDICYYRALSHIHTEFLRCLLELEGDAEKKHAKELKKLPLFDDYQKACWSKDGEKTLKRIGVTLI